MRLFSFFCLIFSSPLGAAMDVGVGTSSVTSGRPVPALALGYETLRWSSIFRSTGVQTSIYAQNAWTLGLHKTFQAERFGPLQATMGFGVGFSSVVRSYRPSVFADEVREKDSIFGPSVYVRFKMGPVYLGFDTLLGLTPKLFHHLTLNFQDVAHMTVGLSQ